MTPKETEILDSFYKKLRENVLRKEKNPKSNSILTKLIDLKSNTASKYLQESAFKAFVFPRDDLIKLANYQLIRDSDIEANSYVLTANGIWDCEKRTNIINEHSLIDFIENKYFKKSSYQQKLDYLDKIVLLSMIGIRIFSEECSMDLENENVMDHWWDIFQKCGEYLHKKDIISTKKLKVSKLGNEHPTSYIMRRRNELQKKTKHIYCAPGKKKYFLNVEDNVGHFSKENLKSILKSIFGKIDDIRLCDDISEFTTKLAYDYAKYVCKSLKYISPHYDYILSNSINEFYSE